MAKSLAKSVAKSVAKSYKKSGNVPHDHINPLVHTTGVQGKIGTFSGIGITYGDKL